MRAEHSSVTLLTLLIAGKLFTQQEVFCCQLRRWTQTEPKDMDAIDQRRQQRTREMYHVVEQACTSCHGESIPQQQGCNP